MIRPDELGRSRPGGASTVFRNMAIGALVLFILILLGGFAYTWYLSQNNDNSAGAVVKIDNSELAPATVKHAKPNPNASVGVSVQMITSPVTPGMNASISVRTNNGANCTIKVVYDKVEAVDSGLVQKTADEYGMASWSWTVGESVPLGKWPVTITCRNSVNSGVGAGDLEVVSSIEQ